MGARLIEFRKGLTSAIVIILFAAPIAVFANGREIMLDAACSRSRETLIPPSA